MTLIHFAINPRDRFAFRQTPAGDGRWEDMRFVTDPGDEQPDWLVVYDHPPANLETRVPRHRRIVFLAEPRSIKRYDAAFIDQFGIAVSQLPPERFDGVTYQSYSAVPWFYGLNLDDAGCQDNVLNFDGLASAHEQTDRVGLISAICSTKTLNRNQVRRLRFLNRLKRELGDKLTIFGRGFNRISDKAEGLDGFRYHLVLENNLDRHGWTEKLADPILAGVYPIFGGGPGLDEDFDPAGFTQLDIRNPGSALRAVMQVLEDDPASRPDVKLAMQENKRRLMMEHQIFPLMAKVIRDQAASSDNLPSPIGIHQPRKPRLRRLARPFRPMRTPFNRLYLTIFERG